MNTVNPKKLLHSKWTAVKPVRKELHFTITEVEFDEENRVIRCVIEAVMTRRSMPIDWQTLKDPQQWRHGWV